MPLWPPRTFVDGLDAVIDVLRVARETSLDKADAIAAAGHTVEDVMLGMNGACLDRLLLDLEEARATRNTLWRRQRLVLGISLTLSVLGFLLAVISLVLGAVARATP
jgi:hypothetical protein